jgi:hypothetical protein
MLRKEFGWVSETRQFVGKRSNGTDEEEGGTMRLFYVQ